MNRTVSHGTQSLGPCIREQRSASIASAATAGRARGASICSSNLHHEEVQKEISNREVENEDATSKPEDEESPEARIERLGRERPPAFKSTKAEIAFVFSICMCQVITETFVSGFTVILPTLTEELNISRTSAVWPATAFSLAIASTLLFFGRLGDMYGGYPIYVGGLTWLTFWSIIAGFSINPLMLDFCRALQGLGAAAYLPTGVMLMGSIYRPGPRKNLVFSIYGACAVFGFFVGIFFAGVVGQYTRWGWYFWIGAFLAAITAVSSYFSIPSDSAARRKNGIEMDWLGSALIVSGLILTIYAITDSAHAPQGWKTPYIPTLLVIGCSLLGAAVYVEGWVAKLPLLPFDVFAVKSMKALSMALLLNFGTLGVYLLYCTQYMEIFMGASPLQVVACAIFATIGVDITLNVATIFVTTNMPSERQGLAGGLINSILHLGITFCLGFADIIQAETEDKIGLLKSYKAVFWFGVAAAAVALFLMTFFVSMEKAKSDLTADEKRELERAATENSQHAVP